MVEIFHAGRLFQELFNLPLREAIHCWRKILCHFYLFYSLYMIKRCLVLIENSHFIVFTATFSDVPSGCLKCPSTTEPNSPDEIKPNHTYVILCTASVIICINLVTTVDINVYYVRTFPKMKLFTHPLQEPSLWKASSSRPSCPEVWPGVHHWHQGSQLQTGTTQVIVYLKMCL